MKCVLLIIFFLFGASAQTQDELGLTFLVHNDNPVTEISLEEISALYLKKKQLWPNGTKARFIDQKDNSAAKKLFSRKVLKKTAREVDLYWIGEKNFSGQSAPIQCPSDELLVSTVASIPGAIGFVPSDSGADLSHVKKLKIRGGK